MIRVSLCLLTLVMTASAARRMPLVFEPNRGQAGQEVEYLSRGNGVVSYLNSDAGVLPLGKSSIRMAIQGGRTVRGEALEALPGKSAYLGSGSNGHSICAIPQFGRIRYSGVYPGVDLIYYGNDGKLEYDFQLQAGVPPSRIRLTYEGATPRIDAEGNLMLATSKGEIRQRKPHVYQQSGAHRTELAARYRFYDNGQVGIEVKHFDATLGMTIDPVLEYSSYLDYNGLNGGGTTIRADTSGNLFIAGSFFMGGTSQPVVMKYSPSTNKIIYTTAVGIAYNASASNLAIDSSGNAYLTASSFFGSVIAKVAPDGQSIVYTHTFPCILSGVAVDASGNAYIAGYAESLSNFPVVNAIQPRMSPGATQNAVLAKLSPAGTILFATYWGGSNYDWAVRVVLDQSGNPYLVGVSESADFPVKNGMARKSTGGRAFVTKFSQDGQSVVYSSVFGGSVTAQGLIAGDDVMDAVADASGNIYLTGNTDSVDFPMMTPLQASIAGPVSGFLSVLNA